MMLRAACLLLLFTVGCQAYSAEENIIRQDSASTRCLPHYREHERFTPGANGTAEYPVIHSVLVWQSVVLLICFGAFALLVTLIQKIIRTYIYYDAHLLDTFFDAGGDANFGMVACSIVAKWTVAATFVLSTDSVRHFGIVGHFWYAAGAAIHLFLFAIVAAEIRIKSPGSKTFLQVIYARFGPLPHITLMVFAFLCNLLVAAAVTSHGVQILHQITPGLGKEVISIILAIVVALFTVIGGVGGYMYVAYFASAIFLAVTLAFFCETFFDPLNRFKSGSFRGIFGDSDAIFMNVTCGRDTSEYNISNMAVARVVPLNDNNSLMTFLSTGGLVRGILLILSGFGSIFPNNGYWQSAISAKPDHSVVGFLVAGLTAFAIPFCFSFTMGMSYWALAVNDPAVLLSPKHESTGFIPLLVANKLFGETGDFLMFVVIMTAVITTAANEVLSASAIVLYDIYQTYLSPFIPSPMTEEKKVMPVRFQRALYNEEYLEYDKRCVVLKHAIVVGASVCLIPLALIVLAIDIDFMWMYQFIGIMLGSCAIPISLAVTWHRTTGPGVALGAIGGWVVAWVAWLVYASVHEGGLANFRDNTFQPGPMLVGTATSVGVGGLICVIVSLACGGCDADLYEDEEWEKTREIDNPVLPWAVKYARDVGASQMVRGRPHFYTVRRIYMPSEICAYIIGVLLAVVITLVWPACMLSLTEFTKMVFKSWTLLILIWTAIVTGFMILVPMSWELIQTCRQAYYNRLWGHLEHGAMATDQPPESSERPPSPREGSDSDKDSRAELTPAADPKTSGDTADRRERWKTFIHLE